MLAYINLYCTKERAVQRCVDFLHGIKLGRVNEIEYEGGFEKKMLGMAGFEAPAEFERFLRENPVKIDVEIEDVEDSEAVVKSS